MIQTMILLFFAALLVATCVCLGGKKFNPHRLIAANVGEGVHTEGILGLRASNPFTTRWLLGKWGADARHVDICGAGDLPLGVVGDGGVSSLAEDPINVHVLGATVGSKRAIASEAIALTDELYTAANGKVQNLPVGAGTYYKVGRPLTTAAADGDLIEFAPCYPVKLVVT